LNGRADRFEPIGINSPMAVYVFHAWPFLEGLPEEMQI